MKRFKIFGIELFIALFLGGLSSYLYINNTAFFENLNKKFSDFFLVYRGDLKASENIIIIDIDEKSLEELGQWPWNRDVVAKILENLGEYGIGIVGLDIVFAEEDKSSAKKILQKYGFNHTLAYDNDEVLANTLANTPTILGYLFDFEENIKKGTPPNLNTIIIEKNRQDFEFLPEAKGHISNIELLQSNSFSSGFFNTVPDDDGIVRSVPLLVRYDETIYPSLTLEMIRLIFGEEKITIHYTPVGIASIEVGEVEIPTDRFGRILVNYVGKSNSFSYISAVDVYNKTIAKEKIDGKIALLGTSAAGILDLRATPLESVFPGVEIHANVLDNILNQHFIANPSWVEAVDLLVIFSILILIVLIFTFLGALKTAIFFVLSMWGFFYLSYNIFVDDGIVLNIVYPLLSSTILYMILASLHYLLETKQKELIKDKFSKKVSTSVVEELMKNSKDALEGKEEEITIFFSDIRGFTSISESMSNPKSLISLLNVYMTPMVEIIVKHKGTVDKFIGDAIMAYWNAPVKVLNHADEALMASIEQIRALRGINEQLQAEGKPFIDIGIGLNSGVCIVGEMGSVGRSDYTCIGDPVNLASRTEGLCKTYGAKIIITEFTKKLLQQEYALLELDVVRVKGKEEPIKIYECYGFQNFKWKDYDKDIDNFLEAKRLYNEENFEEAQICFESLSQKSSIKIYQIYKQRCEHYLKYPPTNFDGVFTFETK